MTSKTTKAKRKAIGRPYTWNLKADAIGMAAYYLATANTYIWTANRYPASRRLHLLYAHDYLCKSIQDRKLAQLEGWKLP